MNLSMLWTINSRFLLVSLLLEMLICEHCFIPMSSFLTRSLTEQIFAPNYSTYSWFHKNTQCGEPLTCFEMTAQTNKQWMKLRMLDSPYYSPISKILITIGSMRKCKQFQRNTYMGLSWGHIISRVIEGDADIRYSSYMVYPCIGFNTILYPI